MTRRIAELEAKVANLESRQSQTYILRMDPYAPINLSEGFLPGLLSQLPAKKSYSPGEGEAE